MTVAAEPTDATGSDIFALVELLRGRRVVALTGAGCSTESGIPDYRGPATRQRARNPIQYRAFVDSPEARQRYWARSVIGWPRFSAARPNAAHTALAELERAGVLCGIMTQNVDRLHHRAGGRCVVELHGALQEVLCLGCRSLSSRFDLQQRLLSLNPGLASRGAELAPDGDAELPTSLVQSFQPADCQRCGGILKPNVVFFGEGVPRTRVNAAWQLIDAADVLLVVGSSLAVFSGYRFVRGAAQRGMPIAVVNLGTTRGDSHARLCLAERAGLLLPRLEQALAAPL